MLCMIGAFFFRVEMFAFRQSHFCASVYWVTSASRQRPRAALSQVSERFFPSHESASVSPVVVRSRVCPLCKNVFAESVTHTSLPATLPLNVTIPPFVAAETRVNVIRVFCERPVGSVTVPANSTPATSLHELAVDGSALRQLKKQAANISSRKAVRTVCGIPIIIVVDRNC